MQNSIHWQHPGALCDSSRQTIAFEEGLGCRDPALAAYEAEEVLQRGSLAFVSSIASSVASGVFGVAKAAAWGRQSGFRAGPPQSLPPPL